MTAADGPGAPPGRPEQLDAVLAAVRRLWPRADAVELVHGRSARGPGDLVIVPHARSPRLLVPAGRRAAASAMLRFSADLTPRQVAERLALAVGLRAGAARLLGDRVVVRGGLDGSLVEHLGGLLGGPVSVSLGVGTARVNRKPVLGVFDARGRAVAYAKVGDSSAAARHVRAEAAALARLGSVHWRGIEVPRLLHAGEWDGLALVVMTALATPPGQRPSLRRVPPSAAMDELAAAFDDGPATLRDSPLWHRCLDDAARVGPGPWGERLRAALAAAAAVHGDAAVRLGAWHGDLTPWNLARRGRVVQLWDWERFATGVPVGADRVHFAVNTVDGGTPDATTLLARVAALESSGPASRPVAVGYLAALACRSVTGLADLQGGPGGDGGDVPGRRAAHGRAEAFTTALEQLAAE